VLTQGASHHPSGVGRHSVIGQDLANEALTTSIEEILRLNATAVGSRFVGSEYEHESLMNWPTWSTTARTRDTRDGRHRPSAKELEQREARTCLIPDCAELGAASSDLLVQEL